MMVARLTALVAPSPAATASPPRRTITLNLHPEGRGKKTVEEVLGLFVESARLLPVLLVIEDLEWADPSTLQLLKLLVNRRHYVRWMTILSFESRFEIPWSHRAHVMHIALPRLTRRQGQVVLDCLSGDQALDSKLRREIIARADGVPLFLEEQARLIEQTAAVEAADDLGRTARRHRGAALPAVLPTILKHWLSARLERLGAAGKLARLAAVIGEEFSHARLAASARLDAVELERALDLLVDAGILIRPAPASDLAFSHSLIRRTIHDSLDDGPRRETHLRVVETLREGFAETAARRPELIAHHYDQAGMPLAAALSWRAAAEQAVRASANLEAAERARRGLRSLDSIDDGDDRQALEIDLRIILGAALGIAKGFAAADVETAYDQALELVYQAPRGTDRFPALQELASYYLTRGRVSTACEIASKALRGLRDSDIEILPSAYRALGLAKLLQGDFASAKTDLETSLAPYAVHRSQLREAPPSLGAPMAETLGHLSLAEWFLGRPNRALKHSTDSLTLARRFNDPYARVFTVFRACHLHVLRREPAATSELAHELVELANRHGFLFFIAAGMFLEGQALAAQGQAIDGLQMMSGGLDGVWASGMEVGRPRNLALLAEACGRSKHFEQGLSLIKEGIAAVEITGEGHYEAELFRLQGELLRHSGASEQEIEESLLKALGVARRQGTIALELRAAISLSRLRRAQDESRQARELLAMVYGRFDEGFDTADLKEAAELLNELS